MPNFRIPLNAWLCLKVDEDRAEEKALRLVEELSSLIPLVPFLGLSFRGVHKCLINAIKKYNNKIKKNKMHTNMCYILIAFIKAPIYAT